MNIYSVTVEGEGDDAPTFFATKHEARTFARKHTDSGIECGPVVTHAFATRADLVAYLNDLMTPVST